jgi:hypothetical protein
MVTGIVGGAILLAFMYAAHDYFSKHYLRMHEFEVRGADGASIAEPEGCEMGATTINPMDYDGYEY